LCLIWGLERLNVKEKTLGLRSSKNLSALLRSGGAFIKCHGFFCD
jgi:hypothetical protein